MLHVILSQRNFISRKFICEICLIKRLKMKTKIEKEDHISSDKMQ